jgi:hypothetical protein
MYWTLRLADENEVPLLERLIPLSIRVPQSPYYCAAQMEAALGPVFGVDRQFIRDGTFLVAEHSGQIIGCAGWSKRRASFGRDQLRNPDDTGQPNPKKRCRPLPGVFCSSRLGAARNRSQHPPWLRGMPYHPRTPAKLPIDQRIWQIDRPVPKVDGTNN